jgi:superfamily II RNA helicase
MVKVCAISNYPEENEEKYKDYFAKFNYPLHIFQKWAIESVVTGNHALVCCPTGSGKSLPAEFALDYFHSKGKKTIYCSPIKSLSNQKFYDFTQKYPHICVGIITGDVRNNPDADVLVMTTEILLNKLYQTKSNDKINSFVSFEMNIETELGCVIFDEIHYINDESRGHVWENSIMLLPPHIQMIGLSATLDDPTKFAKWLEHRGEEKFSDKIVYLTAKRDRAVPLIHYSFITATQGIFKAIKNKTQQEEIKAFINKPHVIQDAKGKFNDVPFFKMTKMLELFASKDIRMKKSNVLNQVSKYLTENEMTPAICYMFSIKQIEMFSKEITTNLLEFDSKVPYIAKRDCAQILRSKLPNFEEYLHLPEYITLVSLLEKGVAMHHSKMLPILREIVEIFFAKGYIKLLFATESVAIGLNLPVKTCIFTDVYKHDGTSLRILQAHEYTQAAGRAGRLGLDTVGHVIHLNNLFRNNDSTNYKTMMNGKPQTLTSKFKISYNLILNLLDIEDKNLVKFAKRSMVTGDLDKQVRDLSSKIKTLNVELENIKTCCGNLRTPVDILEALIDLQKNKMLSVNKKRKDIERQIQQLHEKYTHIEEDIVTYQKIELKEKDIFNLQRELDDIQSFVQSGVISVLALLKKDLFVEGELVEESLRLTFKGKMASQLREINCLVFADLFENKSIDELTSQELVALFSCFTNISVQDDLKENFAYAEDAKMNELVTRISKMYADYQKKELDSGINTGLDYTIHYDLLRYTSEWCNAQSVEDCKLLLQKLGKEKEIFLGEFVKALLKINNIANEMEKIAELTGNIAFLSKLREIPVMTMKYVVTNQSLYI